MTNSDQDLSNFTGNQNSGTVFNNEEEIRKVVGRCHDILFKDEGLDPAKAYDELTKLMVAKVYDEKESTEESFYATDNGPEGTEETAERVRTILDNALEVDRFESVLNVSENGYDGVNIDLSNHTIHKIVSELESYQITGTYSEDVGADIKGTMFQKMVGETFRAELGAYFTPKKIADFMVEFLDVSPDMKTLDPACGSGGFFISCLDKFVEDMSQDELESYVEENIWGSDINHRMVKTTRFNLLTYSGSCGNIFLQDALKTEESSFDNQDFDCVLSNPPFAGQESRKDVLANFEVGRQEGSKVNSLSKEIPFIERIIDLLDEGGVAGFVLPNSIFDAKSSQFTRIREYILDETKILGVIGLPRKAFVHTDTGITHTLLFVEKNPDAEDYEVFYDWANEVGIDTLGNETGRNDLPDILDRYKSQEWPERNRVSISEIKRNGRMDPSYYHPEKRELEKIKNDSEDLVSLNKLVEEKREYIPTDERREEGNQICYVQVGSCSKEGEIEEWRQIIVGKDNVPSRLKLDLKPDLLLVPNHRDSIKSGRSAILVPEFFPAEIDEKGQLFILDKKVENPELEVVGSDETIENLIEEGFLPSKAKFKVDSNRVITEEPEIELAITSDNFVGFATTTRFLSLYPTEEVENTREFMQYVQLLFDMDFVRKQAIKETTGAASPELKYDNLSAIEVPTPPDNNISEFMEGISVIEEKIQSYRKKIEELEDEKQGKIEGLMP